MVTENTSLKNTIPAGESGTNTEMIIGKINTYQRTFLIVAGSSVSFLVLVAVAGTNGDQHLQSSAHKIAEGAVALADYQVDSANLALTEAIVNGFKISEEGNGNSNVKKSRELKQQRNKKSKRSKNKKKDKKTTPDNSGLLSVSENDEGINLGDPGGGCYRCSDMESFCKKCLSSSFCSSRDDPNGACYNCSDCRCCKCTCPTQSCPYVQAPWFMKC